MTTALLPQLSQAPSEQTPPTRIVTVDWRTFSVLTGCLLVWGLALSMPQGWQAFSFVLLVLSLTLHSSLSHELLHGIVVRSNRISTAIGLIQPGLFVPYLRFKEQHLAHHHDARLTDPYDDPESHYLDPAVWERVPFLLRLVLQMNNTLLGRMILGPAIGLAVFWTGDLRRIAKGDTKVLAHWVSHVPGVLLVLGVVAWSEVSLWSYLLACYGALSVLRIRTFLEHRAHERASGRTVIIEDSGPLAFLFLNNNYHAVHHIHPQVAWYRLPSVYRARRAAFVARNQGYVYRSYGTIFAQYLLRAKDPVAHPLWRRGHK
ncbi:Fatty acid desaturase family protein [Sulfitobacter noctilucicola]|uniref:Fatty acid desaturase n=1 Tax=Sulfitobacter noctilucicola TaxID=1342301 RepID=A0A7W6MA72_9RHOB|nr:fatty acid desaturase [Sulfitobacter noctilucicola]KIN63963.1 Fatty acid desaturase family protein [Sulfitobacter noctilucicola]MBB4175320.1 fatty acid desaturase [Sulfitobacter noctilucicola]